jgi:hypothetical protein
MQDPLQAKFASDNDHAAVIIANAPALPRSSPHFFQNPRRRLTPNLSLCHSGVRQLIAQFVDGFLSKLEFEEFGVRRPPLSVLSSRQFRAPAAGYR